MSSSKKTSSYSRRLYGILLHPCSGKTALANSVHGKKGRRNVVFVDVDANIKYEPGQTSIDYFPKIRQSIDKAYHDYPKYKIVVISSNQKLFEFLKVSKGNVFTYVPDGFLLLNMLVDRGLLETPIEGTILNESSKLDFDSDSDTKTKGRGRAYSLGKEQNRVQEEIQSNGSVVELYNEEMKSIFISRKELLARKHKKYNTLNGLVTGVFADILKQKNV